MCTTCRSPGKARTTASARCSFPRMRGTGSDGPAGVQLHRFIPAHAGNRTNWQKGPSPLAVHPRACGEQSTTYWPHLPCRGSSPRMRGTGCRVFRVHGPRRFIPAHAGNRRSSLASRPASAVHPRACGEQDDEGEPHFSSSGSSPRMRGTGRARRFPLLKHRFIPAHAGNRSAFRRSSSVISVHPRACGEQNALLSILAPAPGSSPRMRGTGVFLGVGRLVSRFIPAHAGNRRQARRRRRDSAVHPRACGEQHRDPADLANECGSSPRMRGTGAASFLVRKVNRFIPAHAGNSIDPSTISGVVAVHPRACGEQPGMIDPPSRPPGSSPRMRGTARDRADQAKDDRFIPAYAGNRRCGASWPRPEPVHPRACGEQGGRPRSHKHVRGSSPRMRGTERLRDHPGSGGRFIPAHAGNRPRWRTWWRW